MGEAKATGTTKKPSDKTAEIIQGTSLYFECKLESILTERGMSQTELAVLTGMRQATINDLIHDRKFTLNKNHIKTLMLVLKLSSLDELYEVRFSNKNELIELLEEKNYVKRHGKTPAQKAELEEWTRRKKELQVQKEKA